MMLMTQRPGDIQLSHTLWCLTVPVMLTPGSVCAQVESTVAIQALQPRVKEIQEKYKGRDPQEAQVGTASEERNVA